GGDKPLPYLTRSPEENPELGCRGVRFCLEEVGMFRTQFRAVLRAGAYGNIRMMVPLVTSLAEVRRVKELLEECRMELRREGLPCGERIPLGVMIETPSATILADLLAKE